MYFAFLPTPRRCCILGEAISISGYASDSWDSPDLLDGKREVEGIARLLWSRHVQRPLSLGLFGRAGSSKSFFTRRLQDQIAELAASQSEVYRVVQVR